MMLDLSFDVLDKVLYLKKFMSKTELNKTEKKVFEKIVAFGIIIEKFIKTL